jgi:hypothetical protein
MHSRIRACAENKLMLHFHLFFFFDFLGRVWLLFHNRKGKNKKDKIGKKSGKNYI